jgi:hypothetical protein
MKFFDRDFISGALDDAEWERRQAAYERRRAEIWPNLPASVRNVIETIPFHDARIELLDMSAVPTKLVLGLYCDTSTATSRCTLEFANARLITSRERDAQEIVEDERSVLIESEIDLTETNECELRFIFKPAGEFDIRFAGLRVHRQPALDPGAMRRAPIFKPAA